MSVTLAIVVAARADDLGKKCFRRRVALECATLGAFLVIQHELPRDARTCRYSDVRHVPVIGCVARLTNV
jgi:hypothetical protein